MRAIFDNAGFVIPGEDVKVAGVKVGKIDSLDVTPDFKAAVVLDITEPGYQDFRRDASCIVRPQSLIGERFVECKPTQARAADAEPPPELQQIERRRRARASTCCRSTNTSQTVDLDLIGNIMREPERERLSLILNELGTGLAGRGEDLNEVIRRADPALQETDQVLEILASQNTHARAAGGQLGHDPRAARARARARGERDPQLERRSPRRPPSARDALAADIQTLPRVPRRAQADDGAPRRAGRRRRRRCSPTSARSAPRHQPRDRAGSARSRRPAIPAVDSLGEAAKIGTPGGHRRAPGDRRPARAGQGRRGRSARRCASVLESFQRHRRHRAR